MDNKFGIEELVDTAADILDTTDILASALKDGFQFTDAGALFFAAPKIQEIVKDGKQAMNELLDLSASEAQEVANRIADRTGHSSTGIIAKVNQGFQLLAQTYGQVKQAQYLGEAWVAFAKSFKPAA